MLVKEVIQILKRFPPSTTIFDLEILLSAMSSKANLATNRIGYKSDGRVYCRSRVDKNIVINEIRKQNPTEFELYYPKSLVALYIDYPKTIYVGKFNCDYQKLIDDCASQKIYIFCYNNVSNEK